MSDILHLVVYEVLIKAGRTNIYPPNGRISAGGRHGTRLF